MPINPQNLHSCLLSFTDTGRTLAEGVGCNLLISNQGHLPAPDDRRRWKQVLAALDDLHINWMRIGIIPTAEGAAWDDHRQAWDFDHPHFQALLIIARWASRRGCGLMFDPFVIPPSFQRFAKTGNRFFAADPHDYARKLILPVAQFFRRCKLDQFRYLGLLNENIWGPGKEGFAAVGEFYHLYKGVREVLDEAGFASLGLLGPSNLSSWEWPIADFIAAGLDPDPILAGYDQHLYLYHFDWINENAPDFMTMSEMERYLRRYADYAHKRGKPMLITELGNMFAGRLFWGERDFEGPASHTSVLMDAELIVRGINAGVDGFLRWAFCVRPDRDGRWSLLENTADGMKPSPNVYPLYRLLSRAAVRGARVYEGQTQIALGSFRYVFGTALTGPAGGGSVLILNDAPGKNLNIALDLPAPFRRKTLRRIVCDEMRKGEEMAPVPVSARGEAAVMLPGSSLTVLSFE